MRSASTKSTNATTATTTKSLSTLVHGSDRNRSLRAEDQEPAVVEVVDDQLIPDKRHSEWKAEALGSWRRTASITVVVGKVRFAEHDVRGRIVRGRERIEHKDAIVSGVLYEQPCAVG